MRIKHFKKQKPLDAGLEDFIIETMDWDEKSNKLVSFCVLQVYYFGETAYEIIKFDSAHGACHVHRFYKRLDDRGEDIGRDISAEAFNECRADIKENWQKYKRWYAEKWLAGRAGQ